MTTTQATLYDDIAELFKRDDFQAILSRLSLTSVIEANHPHIFFFYAKAQQELKVNPYAIIDTCQTAENAFPGFTSIKLIHFYALRALEDNSSAIELGLVLFYENAVDIQFLLDLSALLKENGNPLADVVGYQAQFQIAQYYYNRGDYRQAENAVMAANQSQANAHEAKLLEVKILLSQGRLAEAKQRAEEYKTHTDIAYDIIRLLINLYHHINDIEARDAAIAELSRKYPEDPHTRKLDYRYSQENRSDSENLTYLEKCVEPDALDSWWVVQRASLVHKLSSDTHYLNVTGSKEDFWIRLRTLAESGLTTHCLQQAQTALENDGDIENFLALCQLIFDQGKQRELYHLLNPRLDLIARHPELRVLYAKVLSNVDSYETAFNYLTLERQRTPEDEGIFGCLAHLKLSYFTMLEAQPADKSDLCEYSEYLEKSIADNPEDSMTTYYLGYIKLVEMKYDDALDLLIKARNIGLVGAHMPFNAYWIAYTEFKMNRCNEALTSFETWFEKRVHQSFNITNHLALKALINATIDQEKVQFQKKTVPLKTPFWQRMVFAFLAVLINVFLYRIEISTSLIPTLILKILATLGMITVILWTLSAFKYQRRRKRLLNQTK
ncbi:hypothetical protein [Reinekea sp. G2M2-21]|uniref:tetratricopeptide repeat protein n=1 Tax=Reinekea sp. G2M2-21 TaxID=2788942 RepID=UPI0018AA54B0|nr:hypothetical protein [Reinekea sp. G2M2-21]